MLSVPDACLKLGFSNTGFCDVSDRLQRRKLPVIIGIIIQLIALTLLIYSKPQSPALDMAFCFLFGFGNSAHMLAFSTAADVVQPSR